MINLLIMLCIILYRSVDATNSSTFICDQRCGSTTVPYPFGFSPACNITLNCSRTSSKVQVGSFTLRNITSESLLVDVPPSCNRSLHQARLLFGSNYAISSENALLVQECSTPPSACVIPADLIDRHFGALRCGGAAQKADNISCFSAGDNSSSFITQGLLDATRCRVLYASIAYDTDQNPVPSLILSTVELNWWLDGDCRCSSNATCKQLTSPSTNGPAFRCRCNDGFEGDGFLDGTGCRRRRAVPPKCNPSKYVSGSCGGSTARVAVLVGGILAGACFMAAVCCLCYLILMKRRRSASSSRSRKKTKRLLSQASLTVPLYTYRDMEKATDGFSDAQRLGTGAYGTVYAGKLGTDNKLVAIKRIKNRDNEESMELVMNEIKLVSSVSHPNLVRLLGCCIERGEQILVYEFMPNGTLSQLLQREHRSNNINNDVAITLPWTVRLSIAAETAKAIAYLHSAIHPPIYHRDIKSSNILLDYNYTSKVADFGLSRLGMTSESSHISTAPQGTPGYLDPQYHQNFHLSDKSDVYSFGVVLVEIITARKAVDFSRTQEEVNLATLAVEKIGKGLVDDIIDPYLEPHRDAWTLSSIFKVAELAFRCLAFHRDMRPSMTEVADELEQIRDSGWAAHDDNVVILSPASSMRSFRSRKMSTTVADGMNHSPPINNLKVESPASLEDPWSSEQSSPSANSLLSNPVR